jgi:hypothetical protein
MTSTLHHLSCPWLVVLTSARSVASHRCCVVSPYFYLFCLVLPSAIQNSFFSHFCSATEQMRGGMLTVVCVFPFIFVINAALLFLYGIMFFVYAHSLGCHQTHFPAPHSFFYICFSLPIHIWFLSILAESEVSHYLLPTSESKYVNTVLDTDLLSQTHSLLANYFRSAPQTAEQYRTEKLYTLYDLHPPSPLLPMVGCSDFCPLRCLSLLLRGLSLHCAIASCSASLVSLVWLVVASPASCLASCYIGSPHATTSHLPTPPPLIAPLPIVMPLSVSLLLTLQVWLVVALLLLTMLPPKW